MHDGRYATLQEVLDHYTDKVQNPKNLDPKLVQENGKAGIALSALEKATLIAFLRTLSDEQFIRDAKFGDPGIGNAF